MADSAVKTGKLKQMPKRKTNGAPPAAPEPSPPSDQQTPFDDSPPSQAAAPPIEPKKRGRPPMKDAPANATTIRNIFQIIADVPQEAWTAGIARVKIYRLAPLINRHVNSEHRYIMDCTEPIDEDGLKRQCGSGRYRLYLTQKNQAGGGEHEAARGEVDVLDTAFPPKIPAGEWMDDPRNRQWAWARPKEPAAQQAASSLGEVVDVIRAANEMRKEIREELTPQQPAAQPAAQPVAPVDPWSAAEKILTMRSDNPMVTMLMAQMERMEKSAEAARAREFELQKELREQNRQQPTAPAPKSVLEQITEAGEAYAKLRGIFGGAAPGAEAAAPVIRSRMTGTMEFLKDTLPTIIEPFKPLINAGAQWLMQPRTGPPGPEPGERPTAAAAAPTDDS